MPNKVAQSVRNCAHIMRTPAAMSWSGLISIDVKASSTAAANEPHATPFSAFLSFIILSPDY